MTTRTFLGTTRRLESRVAQQRLWPRDATLGPKARPRRRLVTGSGPSLQMSSDHCFQAPTPVPVTFKRAVPARQ